MWKTYAAAIGFLAAVGAAVYAQPGPPGGNYGISESYINGSGVAAGALTVADSTGPSYFSDGTASGATIDTDADELVVEGDDNAGITLLCSGANCADTILFGDNEDPDVIWIQANHQFGLLDFGVISGQSLRLTNNDVQFGESLRGISTEVDIGDCTAVDANIGGTTDFCATAESEFQSSIAHTDTTIGAANITQWATETLTFAADPGDASKVTSGLIPDGAMFRAYVAEVTTTGTNCTSVNIGDGTDVDMFGATIAVASGTKTSLADATAQIAMSPAVGAQEITVTGVGGNCFDLVIDVSVAYDLASIP